MFSPLDLTSFVNIRSKLKQALDDSGVIDVVH